MNSKFVTSLVIHIIFCLNLFDKLIRIIVFFLLFDTRLDSELTIYWRLYYSNELIREKYKEKRIIINKSKAESSSDSLQKTIQF